MSLIRFDQTDCVRCGRCVVTCPMSILTMEGGNYPVVNPDRAAMCVRCYHCVAACPVSAISVGAINTAACPDLTADEIPRFSQVAHLVRSRRSIRCYDQEKGVTRQQIEQILDVARWAPTARNTGQVKWCVVLGHDKVGELTERVIDALRETEWGPALVAARDRGSDPVLRGASAVVCAYADSDNGWSVVDATIATTTLDLVASALELGTCWAGILMRAAANDPSIGEWLGLRAPQQLLAAMMVGYIGRESFRRIPYRNEQETHWIE